MERFMISVKKQKRIFLITLKYFTISNAAIFRKGEFMTEHNLGKWHHVYDGHGKTFTINDKKVAVFNIEGKLFAFDDECPHLAGSLGSGKLEGKLVTCPNHDWQFDVTNGECVSLDLCDDGSFVETYPVKIENDEIILSLPS